MAHQCLKCGNSYPDGSPQILKGCEDCKGTRFFYTDAPLDDASRAQLGERTEGELGRLSADDERAAPRRIPTKDELPVRSTKPAEESEWMHLGSEHLRSVVEDVVRRAHDRKPVFRMGAAPTADHKTVSEWAREQARAEGLVADDVVEEEADAQVTDVLDDLMAPEREVAWRDASAAKPPTAPAVVDDDEDADLVYARNERRAAAAPDAAPPARRTAPRPVSLAGVELDAEEDVRMRERARAALAEHDDGAAPAPQTELPQPSKLPELTEASGTDASLYPEGQAPETVGIDGEGVYELDVKRLLEKQPIVVHRDGSYSLHLPSLMESLEGMKKRA